jgi:acyl-CoA synthetase (AMP-forming)/AMP-acid ligase II
VLGAVPVAYLLARPDEGSDHDLIADLDARCRDHLSPFKRPVRFNIVDDLPRAATGKIRRRDLRERQLATTGSTG